MKRGIIVVLVLGVMLGTASIASAQVRTTGVIQGRTIDQDGVPLPGVMITVNSPSLMGTQTVYSGSDGAFRVPLLPRGSYTVTFALQGFMTIIREEVDVGVQRTTSLEAEMALSSTEETITVTGKVGYVSSEHTNSDLFYGSGKLAWAPGGGFTSSLEGKLNSDGAYKITSEFKKTFE